MAQAQLERTATVSKPKGNRPAAAQKAYAHPMHEPIHAYIETEQGISKADASLLFKRVACHSSLPAGKLRAKLIPDSSWKRAGKRLGPQASQTTARVDHILSVAERIWGNEADATSWLNSPHPELQGATPLSLLKTEAGGRAVETLLAALDYGFPV